MNWLLAGYMWLFIHRPFEVWPWLGALHIERVYMLITIGAWLHSANKGWTRNRLNLAFGLFFVATLLAWLDSPYGDKSQIVVENLMKIGVFYVLVMSCVRDERTLRFLIGAFLVCTALYMCHSLWEYRNGRHEYRMGTIRMIGVDVTLNDPNSFAASIIYALPLTIPFWRAARLARDKALLLAYNGLSVTCVLLTGSRAGFIGLLVISMILVAMSRYRWRITLAALTLAPLIWFALPEDRQNRYLTIYDPSYGPKNAQESAEGRSAGFYDGLKNWRDRPLFGVGPGAHGLATGVGAQAHNLYGQLLGELGTFGGLAFVAIIYCFVANALETRRLTRDGPGGSDFARDVSLAVLVTVLLLLGLGWGAHNLYRSTWFWFGAFQGLALELTRRRREWADRDVSELYPVIERHCLAVISS